MDPLFLLRSVAQTTVEDSLTMPNNIEDFRLLATLREAGSPYLDEIRYNSASDVSHCHAT
jgi:hypothetical protein